MSTDWRWGCSRVVKELLPTLRDRGYKAVIFGKKLQFSVYRIFIRGSSEVQQLTIKLYNKKWVRKLIIDFDG